MRKLELNGAYRRTHYSTSGSVGTWKVGVNWEPIRDLRLRATRSRDIRAPNLNELFQAGITSAGQTVIDRTNGAQTGGITGITIGNPTARPEIANSLTVGGVYQASWLRGLSLSVDYYNIKIDNSITTLTSQQVVDRCIAGNTLLCGDIVRTGGIITTIFRRPINLSVERERGIDIEASYTSRLNDIFGGGGDGRITLRALATHVFTRSTFDGILLDEAAGENTGAIPDWRINTSIGYDDSRFGAQVTTRSVSSGVYDKAYTSSILKNNYLPGATYVDASLTVKFAGHGVKGEFFFNVDNVFNKDPVRVAPSNQQFAIAPVNALIYDTLGREFRAGARFRF